MRVRRAGADDLDEVALLLDAYRGFYGRPSDIPTARAFLEARLERDESVVIVAVDDEGIAGFTQLYRSFSSLRLAPSMVLNDLFVAPRARRRGVADALIDAAVAHARSAGAVALELATQHSNEGAIRLYRMKGFVADNDEFAHMSLDLEKR